jgi:hypothetical protein
MLDLTIEKDVTGHTPLHFGVNVELQEYAERINLWDWLADSGSTIVRELHPEQSLRKPESDVSRFDRIADKATFDQWRTHLAADPDTALPWQDYRFDECVEWMGVPDTIVDYVQQRLGLEAICSLGYAPRSFNRPIVTEYPAGGSFDPKLLEWSAAASAYEYYFAEIYRFATRYGVSFFSMYNEPEFYDELVHLPAHIEQNRQRYHNPWRKYDRQAYEQVYAVVSVQVAAMSYLARLAADAVEKLLSERDQPRKLLLAGPVSCAAWEPVWRSAGKYLDICDYHIYAVDPNLHHQMYQSVCRRAAEFGKATSVSEYGRRGGPSRLSEILFDMDSAIEAGRVLLATISMARPNQVAPTFATFYLLSSPAVGRNYKHLLYGDMNVLDWTGHDRHPRRHRHPAWHPTAREMQLRHATPAYAMFRMLSRCCGVRAGSMNNLPIRAMTAPVVWQDDHGPYAGLDWLAVDSGDRLIVTLINAKDQVAPAIRLFTPFDDERFVGGVVRQTTQSDRDRLVSQFHCNDGPVVMDVPGRSMVQVIYCKQDLSLARDLRLVEHTCTPGGIEHGLGLYQTTRLRAWADIQGEQIDLSELSVNWTSSEPDVLSVNGAGLVQYQRQLPGPQTITAALPNGPACSVTVNLLADQSDKTFG